MIEITKDYNGYQYVDPAGKIVIVNYTAGAAWTNLGKLRNAQIAVDAANLAARAHYMELFNAAQSAADAHRSFTEPTEPLMTVIADPGLDGDPNIAKLTTQVPFSPALPHVVVPPPLPVPTGPVTPFGQEATSTAPDATALLLEEILAISQNNAIKLDALLKK